MMTLPSWSFCERGVGLGVMLCGVLFSAGCLQGSPGRGLPDRDLKEGAQGSQEAGGPGTMVRPLAQTDMEGF